MERRNLEQRCAIKFCVKLNENTTETYEKLRRVYGEHALSRTQVFMWHKAFLDGRESVEDEPHCGRPCTSKTDENVTKVRDLVRSDRSLTVRMIISVLNFNRQTVHDSDKGLIVSGQRLWTLGCCITTMLPVTLPSLWTNFWPESYFSGSAATMLAWSESVWLLPFPKTQIPPQRSSFLNCGQHPQGHDRPAEGTSTRRLPALLPGVGATSLVVCGFLRELLWRG